MIEYRWTEPPLEEYKNLFQIVGWSASISVTDEKLRGAIVNSWSWISAFDDNRLIGIGRLISDGALYALVCDMIVHPEYQKRGIGSAILNMLKTKCADHGIEKVWLFAAQGQSDFYINNGFEVRPDGAPGMQMHITDHDS